MGKFGVRLVAAVNAGGNWTTTSVSALGPLYRNANNARSNVGADPDGSYPPYVIIQFYFANDAEKRHRVVFTASKNIIGQLDSPNMTYPCLATIKMMGKSFCLT